MPQPLFPALIGNGRPDPTPVVVPDEPPTISASGETVPRTHVDEDPAIDTLSLTLRRRALTNARNREEEEQLLMACIGDLTARGHRPKAIAFALDVSLSRVRRLLARLHLSGEIQSVSQTLATHALPIAADNLIQRLEDGDWDATLQTLKGLGAFRQRHEALPPTGDGNAFHVHFAMPAGQALEVSPQGIVGAPRVVRALPDVVVTAPAVPAPEDEHAAVHAVRIEGASAETPCAGEPRGDQPRGCGGEGPVHELQDAPEPSLKQRLLAARAAQLRRAAPPA